ncbi:MAG: site-2 protease family protein [Planctomycetota bacterium]|nr:site-2 protease family protein [Planctomycetota bacterium]
MSGWWVSTAWDISPFTLLSWVLWVIGSITLHELAHGWAAIRCGDRTPIELGHMTPNPLVHMGGMSLIVFGLFGFAWGAMPVNPSRFRREHDDALVAFAGPAMNLSLAFIAAALLTVWNKIAAANLMVGGTFDTNLVMFLWSGVFLNIALAIFNMVPIPPLDGSRILASFSLPYARLMSSEQGRTVGLIGFLAIFWFGGRFLVPAAISIGEALLALLKF